jgi:DNA-binding transcriptional LysR family regulator
LSVVDVELRQLRAVVAVAESGSFTVAGRRLHLSQQAVSALVRRLERILGVPLFDRTTRWVKPTPECEALLPSLISGLGTLDAALARTRLTGVPGRSLRVAVTPSLMFGPVQDLLEAAAVLGLAEPELGEVWPDELPRALSEGLYDAGLGVEVQAGPSLDIEAWRRQRVDLLVAEDHPFADLPFVRVAQLGSTTLAIPEKTMNVGWYPTLAATLASAGVQVGVTETPRFAGPAPIEVVRGEAATVWLSGMDDRYVPKGLIRVRLCEPETLVTTNLVIPKGLGSGERADLDRLRQMAAYTRAL